MDLKHAAIYVCGALVRLEKPIVHALLECKPLPAIAAALEQVKDSEILLETAYMLECFCDGVYWVMDDMVSSGLINAIIGAVNKPTLLPGVRVRALRCVCNLAEVGTEDDIDELLKAKALEMLIDVLDSKDPEMLKTAIVTLENLMDQFEQRGDAAELVGNFDAMQGVDKMMVLTSHQNPQISKMADEFVKTHFYVGEVPPDYVWKTPAEAEPVKPQ